jgi:hypothetical protein
MSSSFVPSSGGIIAVFSCGMATGSVDGFSCGIADGETDGFLFRIAAGFHSTWESLSSKFNLLRAYSSI